MKKYIMSMGFAKKNNMDKSKQSKSQRTNCNKTCFDPLNFEVIVTHCSPLHTLVCLKHDVHNEASLAVRPWDGTTKSINIHITYLYLHVCIGYTFNSQKCWLAKGLNRFACWPYTPQLTEDLWFDAGSWTEMPWGHGNQRTWSTSASGVNG